MSVELVTDLNAVLGAAGDSSATRTVYGVVIALGLIGVALLVLGIWLFKQTKPELQLLAPLERMDDRAWRKQDPAQMRRDLDSLRPEGARPLLREKSVPNVDADFAQSRPTLGNFDDLQAQLADDTRRASTAGRDPLLAARAGIEEEAADNAEADNAAADAEEAVDHDAAPHATATDSGTSDVSEPDTGLDDTGDINLDDFGVRRSSTDDS